MDYGDRSAANFLLHSGFVPPPSLREGADTATVDVALPATPLTHRRFNRRDRGTYGAYLPASTGEQLMGHATPLDNFYVCGDSTFPGIGMPAVAASGMITAASILSPREHWAMLDRIKN